TLCRAYMVRAARRRLRQDETQTAAKRGSCCWTVALALAADQVLNARRRCCGWRRPAPLALAPLDGPPVAHRSDAIDPACRGNLLRLGAGRLDHLAPLLGFSGDWR